jgi:hypothetical protein
MMGVAKDDREREGFERVNGRMEWRDIMMHCESIGKNEFRGAIRSEVRMKG